MDAKELAELDLAVARAEDKFLGAADFKGQPLYVDGTPYQPTRDGAEAMRLLEKYRLNLTWGWRVENRKRISVWDAESSDDDTSGQGPTPAIAICRAVVALKEKS